MDYWTTAAFLVSSFAAIIYFYIHRQFNYWSRRGISGPPPSLLNFGNLREFSTYGQPQIEMSWPKTYGSIYGFYQFTKPILTINEPELAKEIIVKNFSSFINREKNSFDHEYFNSNLFSSNDEVWRRVRSITSPSFTSGKLKLMHGIMEQCVKKLERYLKKDIAANRGVINLKESITGFTIDVIAQTSFGAETSADGELNRSNVFVRNGTDLLGNSIWRVIAFYSLPQMVNKWLGNTIGMDDRAFDFFTNVSKEIIKQRRAGDGKKRNDLVQLLIDAFVYESELKTKNYEKLAATADNDETEVQETASANTSTKKTLQTNEIIAQCIIFFLAGFETTATTTSMVAYFLALNPHVQDRLHSELTSELDGLDPTSEEYFNKVTTKLPYLDAVIKETLRRNPPLPRLKRHCNVDDYKLGDTGIHIERDSEVHIGIYSIQHNPKYFPDPETFNPDRFMPENKHLLVPYSWLPFGAGPRNCIGMRFAYQEIKLCLATIVRKFRFERAPSTPVPIFFNTFELLTTPNIELKISVR